MNDSKKFIWAYMIENGKITNGHWSYYGGGFDLIDTDTHWANKTEMMKSLRDNIKEIGVDWEKTSSPISDTESEFTDSFHPSQEVETLLGTLVLKNGKSYTIGVGHAETRFTEYAKTLSLLAEDQQRVKDILGE